MDKRETRRGRNYEIKSRNCKVDYAYVILSVDDDDNVKYFSEKGFTATMRHERYTQCINWDQDNRCKPDRGVFLCKIPDHGKICSLANHKLINGELSHTFYHRAYGFNPRRQTKKMIFYNERATIFSFPACMERLMSIPNFKTKDYFSVIIYI